MDAAQFIENSSLVARRSVQHECVIHSPFSPPLNIPAAIPLMLQWWPICISHELAEMKFSLQSCRRLRRDEKRSSFRASFSDSRHPNCKWDAENYAARK